ncbi:alcohol oxidase [Gigaspora margarita]|uniref:Alcohol oxidase n=1 Tax=Gigaspora margarita TaxID=4874 RepID=A0A8H4A686_GIGMA|nr:alcohol oxidase [Gigaspora margarita]
MASTVNPTEEVLNKGFSYPRGKVIGGYSTVNALAYMRGHKADYELWAAQDPEYIIWNYYHCLEAFKAVENNARKNPDVEFEKYHGFNGLLYVQDPAVDEFDISKDVFKVVRKFGIPSNKDFNGAKQNGVGRYQFTMKDGKRFTLADGYLKDALKKVIVSPPKPFIEGHPHALVNDNVGKFVAVNVKSSTHMLNIIWDEKKKDENVAIGVKYSYNGKDYNCYIAPKGEVIICGGAINSPQILMLSGIGPKKNLEDNSIKVRKELPVGHKLRDHPFCIITATVSVPGSTTGSILNYSSFGVDFVSFYKGNIEGKIPNREEFNDERPDIQQYSGAVLFDKGILDEYPTDKKEFYSMLTALNLPSSVDLYRMMSSLKLSRKILEQPPLSTDWGVKVIGLDEVNDDKEWEKYIRKRTTSSAHPCGTVKMAPEFKGGCVNHRLQVYGTKNLRVVDASIFPTIPAGNLNAPTAMVAWRASKLIKEDYYKKV